MPTFPAYFGFDEGGPDHIAQVKGTNKHNILSLIYILIIYHINTPIYIIYQYQSTGRLYYYNDTFINFVFFLLSCRNYLELIRRRGCLIASWLLRWSFADQFFCRYVKITLNW